MSTKVLMLFCDRCLRVNTIKEEEYKYYYYSPEKSMEMGQRHRDICEEIRSNQIVIPVKDQSTYWYTGAFFLYPRESFRLCVPCYVELDEQLINYEKILAEYYDGLLVKEPAE